MSQFTFMLQHSPKHTAPAMLLVQLTALGTLSAPMGIVTIAFMHAVGAAALLADMPTAARQGLNTFQVLAVEQLTEHNGYAVEVADGLVLASFHSPADAIAWALACQKAMADQVCWHELLQP